MTHPLYPISCLALYTLLPPPYYLGLLVLQHI